MTSINENLALNQLKLIETYQNAWITPLYRKKKVPITQSIEDIAELLINPITTILHDIRLRWNQLKSFESPKLYHDQKCVICDSILTSRTTSYACSKIECQGKYCKTCFNQHIETSITSAAYTIPTIKCCLCLDRITSNRWYPDLPSNCNDIAAKIHKNARALLDIRCASCDTGNAIFRIHPKTIQFGSSLQLIMIREIFVIRQENSTHRSRQSDAQVVPPIAVFSNNTIIEITKTLANILNESIDNITFVNEVSMAVYEDINNKIDGLGKVFSQDYINDFNLRFNNLISPNLLKNIFINILNLIQDIEIRQKIQLILLYKFPMIFSSCYCKQPHCFNCKVGNHHTTMTCTEYRSQEIIIGGVQSCPECQVPTIRSEGCYSITCICGHDWYWNSSTTETSTEATSQETKISDFRYIRPDILNYTPSYFVADASISSNNLQTKNVKKRILELDTFLQEHMYQLLTKR